MLDKDVVRKAYIEALEKKLMKARSSYETARKDTIEAEGRMVTRYDSTKAETAWLADGYLKEVKELEQYISNMKENKAFANISDTIFLDLLINTEYQQTYQYILSRSGEHSIPEKLFIDVIGSTIGDSITFKDENNQQVEYRVKNIIKNNVNTSVFIESLVTVTDQYGDSVYYITNYIGGINLILEGEEVFCISKQTPIAKAILGKTPGENVTITTNESMTCTIKNFI